MSPGQTPLRVETTIQTLVEIRFFMMSHRRVTQHVFTEYCRRIQAVMVEAILVLSLARGPFSTCIITDSVMQSAHKRPISNMLRSDNDRNARRSESKFSYM